MSLEFDNKFGLVFEEDTEDYSLEEMKYTLNIGSGRHYQTINVVYQPDYDQYLIDEVCPAWRSLDEQIKFYKQLVKGLKKIAKEVED